MKRLKSLVIVIGALALSPNIGTTHHSHASLDPNNVVTLAGVVSEFLWNVPHVYIIVDVPQGGGEVVQYTIETLNPPSLARVGGWAADTFVPGDAIMWQGEHDRDPDRPYTGLAWAQKPDGPRLFSSSRALQAYIEETGIEPSYAATVNTEVTPAESFPSNGYWVRMGADGGGFSPYREPPDDMPLTDKGRELVAQFHESQNPLNECIYPGPPRMMMMPMSYHFRMEDQDKLTIDRDLWPEPRVIHMTGDVADASTSWGHSVGRFEDDVLVIESTDFVDDEWGIQIGLHSSAQKHLVERYWLSDNGMRLNAEFTVTDPEYFTMPYTMTHQWRKVADKPLLRAECSMEAAWFYITAGYEEDEWAVPVNLPD